MKRLYYFTSSTFALEAIRDQLLKISRIADLNDPFEFLGLNLRRSDRRALEYTKRQLDARFGLLCLSGSWRHPLMWAHYADKFKGMALGFDVLDGGTFKPVSYVTERMKLADLGLRLFSEFSEFHMRQLLFSKFDAWSYETEYRVYCDLAEAEVNGLIYFKRFAPELRLTHVIVGPRSLVGRNELDTALGAAATKTTKSKARPGFQRFEVVENKRAADWPQ